MPVLFQRVEAAAVLVATTVIYALVDASWVLFAALILAPDLFMLGYVRDTKLGALLYNVGHFYLMPIATMGLWWFFEWPQALAVGLIWAAHIGMDRMFGYGLKYQSGFKDTHLGSLR